MGEDVSRELDKLVAEALGYTVESQLFQLVGRPKQDTPKYRLLLNGQPVREHDWLIEERAVWNSRLPHYSTDANAAWALIANYANEFSGDEVSINTDIQKDGTRTITVTIDDPTSWVDDRQYGGGWHSNKFEASAPVDQLALAICKAWLQWKGVTFEGL